jgi:hypothetical protein
MRQFRYALVAIATFVLTRLFDHLASPPEPLHSVRSLSEKVPAAPTSTVVSPPLEAERKAMPAPTATARSSARTPYLAVIGFPVGVDERNSRRRALLRELWYPEYPNLGADGTIRAEFVIGLLTYQGDGHDDKTVQELHDEHAAYGDLALVNAREATRDPYRGDPKNTGEKIVAWFQHVVVAHRGTRFFLKADWDTWVHTTRLEHNLRTLLSPRAGALYFGNTLWCSYSMADYQPCGYGFGPLQASGAKKAECPKLPHGREAIGPYPYAAGLFWGMSYELVQWIAGSRLVRDFWLNASNRYEPPYWIKGEDSAFGFFAHIAPFPKLTPIHWGWETIHDGWEFRSQAERGLCTHHTSETSLAVHSMHTRDDFLLVREQLRERCNATCMRTDLPFTVDGLADLCGRNPSIPSVYAKCVAAGFRAAASVDMLPPIRPRPRCHSVGANVEFIASKAEGGTITCDDDEPPSEREWSLERAAKRRQGKR